MIPINQHLKSKSDAYSIQPRSLHACIHAVIDKYNYQFIALDLD